MFSTANVGEAEALAQTANCCNIFSFFFAWWIIFSPLIVWKRVLTAGIYNRLGTGAWVASSTTQTFDCGSFCTGVIQNQWVYWSDLDGSNVCQNGTKIAELWAEPYGFCDNGEFDRGTEIRTIEAFTILTLILSSFAACSGCSVYENGSKGLNIAGCMSFLTWLSAVVAFSVMASFKWYSDLRSEDGSYMPYFTLTASGATIVPYQVRSMWFGPTFGMLVTIFICSFMAHVMFHVSARKIDAELASKDDNADYIQEGAPNTEEGGEVAFA